MRQTIDNKGTLAKTLFVLIALLVSALLGIASGGFLSTQHSGIIDNYLWKNTVIVAVVAYFCALQSGLFRYIPIITNLFRAVAISIFLTVPFITGTVLVSQLSINACLWVLPIIAIFLIGFHLMVIVEEIDCINGKKRTIRYLIIIALYVVTIIAALIITDDLPMPIILLFCFLIVDFYVLWILRKAMRNSK